MTFVWLHLDVILAIHEAQLSEHGGRQGIRDVALLKSALARPQQRITYGDPRPDTIELAATYAIAILQNHPFIDGNKRTAFVALVTFLRLNGYELQADDASCVLAFLDLATETSAEADFIAFIRNNTMQRDGQ